MLPVLLFETTWMVRWLALVAAPNAASGSLDAAMADMVVSCSLVVVIVAVIPWRYAWAQFARASADRGQ